MRLGRPPLAILVPGALAAVFLVVPLLSLLLTTDWSRVHLTGIGPALGITLLASAVTVVACLVLGTPLAWLLARTDFPGRSLVRAVVTVPLVLPPVVGGVALLSAFGRHGLVGALFAGHYQLPFTTTAVVLAHTFCSLPFYVLALEGALRAGGAGLDEVAATLGADRWTTFVRVTLPLALPGIAAGSVLAWARSLGEFGATITFAGNYPGTTQTMPSLIYATLQDDPRSAQALSLILLAVSLGILALLRNRWLVTP